MAVCTFNTFFGLNCPQETRENLEQVDPLLPSYVVPAEQTTLMGRVVSTACYPYSALHSLLGRSQLFQVAYSQKHARIVRPLIDLTTNWRFRRITLQIDNMDIDAMVAVRIQTIETNRWIIPALGLTEIWEWHLANFKDPDYPDDDYYEFSFNRFTSLAEQLNANLLYFNYPEMGASTGTLTANSIVRAHVVARRFLEEHLQDHENRQIVLYGHSIGAVAQGLSLTQRPTCTGIRYVVVADRSLSQLYYPIKFGVEKGAGRVAGCSVGLLATGLGWNISALEWYRNPTIPTIVTSAIKGIDRPTEVTEVQEADYIDDTIPWEGSLVRALTPHTLIRLFGVREQHKYAIQNVQPLVEAIEEGFSQQTT